MPINSKRKGRVGEAELARKLREHGYDARRGAQFCALNGDPDVIGLPGLWLEVKRVEKLNIYEALSQAIRDCKDLIPTVMHRRNNHEWIVTLRLDDFMSIYKEWETHNG